MTKVQTVAIISVLLSIPVAYTMLNHRAPIKIIKIPQLKIESKKDLKINKESTENTKIEAPSTILSKLKVAVKSSQEKVIISEEEQAKEILRALKESTHTITFEKSKIVKVKKSTPVSSKPKVKSIKIVKEKNNSPKNEKSKVVKVKKTTPLPIKSKEKPIEIVKNKNDFIKEEKSKIVKVKKHTPPPSKPKQLSREEEVAQYQKKHQDGLEVVGVSKLFEIEEPQTNLPDSSYFEPIKKTVKKNKNTSLQEVKTLGVVEVSKQYEVANVTIPQKVELAKEAIVDISSASVENEELKQLEFVDTLEVIEVSPTFETIEAEKYIQ